jgi:hypothetical protein
MVTTPAVTEHAIAEVVDPETGVMLDREKPATVYSAAVEAAASQMTALLAGVPAIELPAATPTASLANTTWQRKIFNVTQDAASARRHCQCAATA